ncbi:hypothetical protein B0O80DRAFT_70377 [Mortierella sp. GBAus27b]|nr:hypothetical protein B0O80DRAFT_70377 [Mortierella sp. GBAus27b]
MLKREIIFSPPLPFWNTVLLAFTSVSFEPSVASVGIEGFLHCTCHKQELQRSVGVCVVHSMWDACIRVFRMDEGEVVEVGGRALG